MSERAERLRNRRNRAKSKPEEQDEQDKTSKPSKLDKPSETEESDETAGKNESGKSDDSSVKDERVGTYMYLPENQKDDLDLAFKKANLSFEEATGEELEKNRHFYPLIIQAGLESLDGLDGQEIQDRLECLDI